MTRFWVVVIGYSLGTGTADQGERARGGKSDRGEDLILAAESVEWRNEFSKSSRVRELATFQSSELASVFSSAYTEIAARLQRPSRTA